MLEGVGFGGRGIVEFEAVGAIVHAYVPDEGLIEVAEEGEGGGLLAHGMGAVAEFAGG